MIITTTITNAIASTEERCWYITGSYDFSVYTLAQQNFENA